MTARESSRKLLTSEQTADLLGLASVQSLYNMRHRGVAPPAIKWGNTLRWRRADVEAWLDAHTERRS